MAFRKARLFPRTTVLFAIIGLYFLGEDRANGLEAARQPGLDCPASNL
jgi:hypothetical protein